MVRQEPTGGPPASACGASLGPSAQDLGCFLQFFLIKKMYEDRSRRWVIGIFFRVLLLLPLIFLLKPSPRGATEPLALAG